MLRKKWSPNPDAKREGFGYESQAAQQSSHTVYRIVVLFTLLPAVGHLMLIVIVTRWYRLDDASCSAIREELDRAAAQ
jgi:Na+/melibiose symporter-like transporter